MRRPLALCVVALTGCASPSGAHPFRERLMAVLPADVGEKRIWHWPTFSPDGRHCGWIETLPDGAKAAIVDGRRASAPHPDI